MAAKLECPKCKKILKEEGDEMKEAQGEYRVYKSCWNSKHAEGTHRMVKCLECNKYSEMSELRP